MEGAETSTSILPVGNTIADNSHILGNPEKSDKFLSKKRKRPPALADKKGVQRGQKNLFFCALCIYMSIFEILGKVDIETKLHLLSIVNEETKELIRNQIKTILKQDAILGKSMNPECNHLEKLIGDNKEKIKRQNALNNKTLYTFITISFDPKVELELIKKFNEKFIKKACFTKCIGVIEQRGTVEKNNIGSGLHAHYLVERKLKYKPTKMRIHVKDACKKLVGNVDNDKFVNFKVLSTEFAKDKQDYILGVKYGEDKDKKQEGDEIYREQHDIKKFYGDIIF